MNNKDLMEIMNLESKINLELFFSKLNLFPKKIIDNNIINYQNKIKLLKK